MKETARRPGSPEQTFFSKALEADDVQAVRRWLEVSPGDYWHNQHKPGEPAAPNALGADMDDNLIINTIVPVLFAMGCTTVVMHRKRMHFVGCSRQVPKPARSRKDLWALLFPARLLLIRRP